MIDIEKLAEKLIKINVDCNLLVKDCVKYSLNEQGFGIKEILLKQAKLINQLIIEEGLVRK